MRVEFRASTQFENGLNLCGVNIINENLTFSLLALCRGGTFQFQFLHLHCNGQTVGPQRIFSDLDKWKRERFLGLIFIKIALDKGNLTWLRD